MGVAVIPDLTGMLVARLRAEANILRDVGGAADLDAIDEQVATVPSAFVIPLAERPTEPPTAAQFSQLVDAAVGVVFIVSSAAAGEDLSELVIVRRAAFAALLGWAPAGCLQGLAYAGGRLIKLSNNLLYWQDDFVTNYQEVL